MKGIFTALICSFDEKGQINEQGLREIVRYNIDTMEVDGLYVNGSTGENFMLSFEEKKRVFDIVKDEAKDEVSLIAQVGALNINEAKELASYATDLGYDALSAVTPFYYKFDFVEIKDYYNEILEDVDNQMIIYSIPALTGVNMDLEQFKELFKNEKITGVKFTAPDFFLLERLRHAFPEKTIFSGFDEMMLPASVLGIDGAIGSTFNLNGKKAKELLKAVHVGELDRARLIQKESNDLISAILDNGLYQTIKEVLKDKGVDAGYCRKPMKKPEDSQVSQAKEISRKFFS